MLRPYTRSLDPQDYTFLPRAEPLRAFVQDMRAHGVGHRDWCEHRLWEYASMMQQMEELGVPRNAEMIDVGAGGSFFDPYCAQRYPLLCCTDSMKYGDVTQMVAEQRAYYKVALPLYDLPCEDMSPNTGIGWGGATDKFDVTMCISSIEHVDAEQHDNAMHELWRITKPGGLIFITSDYFKDLDQWNASPSRYMQLTPYTKDYVLALPKLIPVEFVGETDLDYRGDFVHNHSFVNICLRKVTR